MFLPIEQTYNEAELRTRWSAEDSPAWADGDTLTLVCEKPGAAHVVVWPVFQMPMQRVAGDLFAFSAQVDDLDKALISYAFWELDQSGAPTSPRPPDPDGRYRGPNARPEAPSNRQLRGVLDEHIVPSEAFRESRKVAVYRPPGHTPEEQLPVVYATDGGLSFVGYARRLDAAIEHGITPRVVVVAAHSAGANQQTGNLRGMEYLPGFDTDRFAAHRTFFTEELPTWAEVTFGVRSDRAGRAAFGCSDGAVHALMLAMECSELYGNVIAYSGGMPPDENTQLDPETTPVLHLGAGSLEGPFYMASQAWAGFCHFAKVEHTWTETVAGHDLIQWCENLPHALAAAFGD